MARSVRRSVRYVSTTKVLGLPLVAVARGPDPARGEDHGHAVGIIAIGDRATGGIALGGISCGILSLGGIAVGGLTIGGVAAGLLALGGVAVGGLVLGGVAIGGGATGGVAIGHYAQGGATIGTHVVSPQKTDPQAEQFFESWMPGVGRASKD